jgi:hypothetical protein
MLGSRPHVLQYADCTLPSTFLQEQRIKAPGVMRSIAQPITDASGFRQRQADTFAGCLSSAPVRHNNATRNITKGHPRTLQLARSIVGKIRPKRALSQLSRLSVVARTQINQIWFQKRHIAKSLTIL